MCQRGCCRYIEKNLVFDRMHITGTRVERALTNLVTTFSSIIYENINTHVPISQTARMPVPYQCILQ